MKKILLAGCWFPLLLACALRFVNLGSEALWYDEAFTAWFAKLPTLSQLLQAVQSDVHPPTWYVIEWVFVHTLGNSEFILRIPSALAGILVVWLVWKIAQALGFVPTTAWMAAVLMAVLPVPLYYSQEARSYAFLTCTVALMVYGALVQRWWLFMLGATATLYSHNLAIFHVTGVGGAVLIGTWHSKRLGLYKPLLALLGAGILWLPWGIFAFQQAQAVSTAFWVPPLNLGAAISPLPLVTLGSRMLLQLALPLWVVAFVATFSGLIHSWHWLRQPQNSAIVGLLFLTPSLLALASLIWHPVYLIRALLPLSVGFVLLWASAFCHLSIANRRLFRFVVSLTLGIGLVAHYFPANGRMEVPKAISPVREQWQDGDVMFYSAIPISILFGYYLPDKPYRIDPDAGDLNQSLSRAAKTALGFQEASFPELSQHYKRCWYVFTREYGSRAAEMELADQITARGTRVVAWGQYSYYFEVWLIDFSK